MTASSHDTGERKCPPLRHIQVSGYKEIWPALKDYLLYLIQIPLDDAGNTRLERRFLRPGPEALLYPLTNLTHISFGIGPGLQGRSSLIRLLFDTTDRFDEIFLNHPRKSIERNE